MNKNTMIVGEGLEYSLNCYDTQLNNNVIVVGASGAGKTTGIVIPNIMQATGSYIVTDPKGNLSRKLTPYLKENGYRILNLDLSEPNGDVRYNFFDYIKTEHDVLKIAHILMTGDGSTAHKGHNAFFYQTGELYVASGIAMMKYVFDLDGNKDFMKISNIFNWCRIHLYEKDLIDMDRDRELSGNIWEKLGVNMLSTVSITSEETAGSVYATIGSILGNLNTDGVEKMMTSSRAKLDIESIGFEKTALFVKVSDTDRSLDTLVNIFFTQAMDVLCRVADTKCKDEALPVPVRFIMDDFATNCTIEGFPRMISSIRSRNISTMIMLQAESQLEKQYDKDWATVISNCDTYVYMGGNDLNTAQNISKRTDLPVKKILYMPVGTNWIFRRGQNPINGKNYNCKEHYPDLFNLSGKQSKGEIGCKDSDILMFKLDGTTLKITPDQTLEAVYGKNGYKAAIGNLIRECDTGDLVKSLNRICMLQHTDIKTVLKHGKPALHTTISGVINATLLERVKERESKKPVTVDHS